MNKHNKENITSECIKIYKKFLKLQYDSHPIPPIPYSPLVCLLSL